MMLIAILPLVRLLLLFLPEKVSVSGFGLMTDPPHHHHYHHHHPLYCNPKLEKTTRSFSRRIPLLLSQHQQSCGDCGDDDDNNNELSSSILEDPMFGLALEESLLKIEALMMMKTTRTTMQNQQQPDDDDNNASSSSFSNSWNDLFHFCQNAVHVGKSTIPNAGSGLFASHPMPTAGQIVSFYPVHGIGICGAAQHHNTVATACLHEKDQEYFDKQEDDDDQESAKMMNYQQNLLGNRPIGSYKSVGPLPPMVIDVNPNCPLQKGWMSHCINDGSAIFVKAEAKDNHHNNNEEIIQDYYNESLKKQNCLQIPFGPFPLVATITTKPICSSGEELFTCYEHYYWLQSQPQQPQQSQQQDNDNANSIGSFMDKQQQQTTRNKNNNNYRLLKSTIESVQTKYKTVLEDLALLYSKL